MLVVNTSFSFRLKGKASSFESLSYGTYILDILK